MPSVSAASRVLCQALKGALVALTLTSCAPGDFSYSKRLDGQYRILAVDDLKTMVVCYDTGNGGCRVLIDQTVFEVGWDGQYIVAAQHPAANSELTVYYYINRSVEHHLRRAGVFGPFTPEEFEVETRRLSLPPMSRYAPFIYCSDRPLCSSHSDIFR